MKSLVENKIWHFFDNLVWGTVRESIRNSAWWSVMHSVSDAVYGPAGDPIVESILGAVRERVHAKFN